MKKLKKPALTDLAKERVMRLVDGILSTVILVLAMRFLTAESPTDSRVTIGILFIVLTASKLLSAYIFHWRGDRMMKINCLAAAGCTIVCAVLVFIFGASFLMLCIVGGVYFLTLIASRVLRIIKDHSLRSVIGNGLGIVLLLFFGSVFFGTEETSGLYVPLVCAIFLTGQALLRIVTISFSQIKLNILIKIVRKTFAAEILFGLLLLIVAFSLVLATLEPGMQTFADALWYCFAVVTTIGFGDVTAVTLAGRILSVVLGIYGIIVVALITSVIVNFYNEVKNEQD